MQCDNTTFTLGGNSDPQSTPSEHLNHGLKLLVENIPQELKDRPQWVIWKGVEKPNGKLDKVPYQSRRPGVKAKTTDSSTWGTFEEALEVFEKHPEFDGIGYVFSKDDPFLGIDYDSCIHKGELHDVVSQIVEDLDSYTEVSPSGTGLKSVVRAKKPGTRCSTKKTPWGDEFAMFGDGRFFAITGRVLGSGYREIRESQEAVDRAYRAALGEDQEKSPPPRGGSGGNSLSDEELIKHACRSKKGERFRRHHFDGDSSGYESRSEADMAHLADLCFWTGGDGERMVDLFTSSALYVPQKGLGYVRRSARKAIRTHQGGFYRGGKRKERPKEVLELIEELERQWWENPYPRKAGKTDASIDRALLRECKLFGMVDDDGNLRVSLSIRQLAEIAACHYNTVLNYTKRAKEAGRLDKDTFRAREEDSATFILLVRPCCDTLKDTTVSTCSKGVTTESRYPVADLTTEHYRWRGQVGKGRERALCALEAFGPMSVEELAQRLGWSRARDLRLRYLEPLAERGLVEDRGGVWTIPGDLRDYKERQDEVRSTPYSTVQLRPRRVRSVEGIWTTIVEESGSFASEVDRKEVDIERNRRQREAFHLMLAKRRAAAKAAKKLASKPTASPSAEEASNSGPEPDAEPVEVSWPEVVDGIVVHGEECGCVWCEDESSGGEEAA
jgi:hypothetical protein